MNKSQQVKFESLYAKHVSALKRQGKADKTVEVYARAVRRVAKKSLKAIALSCGIRKHVTPHTLRHCYGALMLEAGVNRLHVITLTSFITRVRLCTSRGWAC